MNDFKVSNQIVTKKISEIRPYVRNPRENDVTVDKLVKIIPVVGFNVPLVLDVQGIIVKGHARFRAGIRLGMTEFPCVISEGTDEQNKLDRISDNRISEFSEWVAEALKEELSTISLDYSDLEIQVTEPSESVTETQELTIQHGQMPVFDIPVQAVMKKFIKVICEKCGRNQFVENNKNVYLDYGKTPKRTEDTLI